jgi:hypothetical protein
MIKKKITATQMRTMSKKIEAFIHGAKKILHDADVLQSKWDNQNRKTVRHNKFR